MTKKIEPERRFAGLSKNQIADFVYVICDCFVVENQVVFGHFIIKFLAKLFLIFDGEFGKTNICLEKKYQNNKHKTKEMNPEGSP